MIKTERISSNPSSSTVNIASLAQLQIDTDELVEGWKAVYVTTLRNGLHQRQQQHLEMQRIAKIVDSRRSGSDADTSTGEGPRVLETDVAIGNVKAHGVSLFSNH